MLEIQLYLIFIVLHAQYVDTTFLAHRSKQ